MLYMHPRRGLEEAKNFPSCPLGTSQTSYTSVDVHARVALLYNNMKPYEMRGFAGVAPL